jgi:hypothetical protein
MVTPAATSTRKSWLDIHSLYNGRLAQPVPGTLAHLGGMAVTLALTGWAASWLQAPVLVALGFFGWTFFEYALHRWILHSRNPVLWRVLHKGHHGMRTMEDPNHRIMHPVVAVPIVGSATFLFAGQAGRPCSGLASGWDISRTSSFTGRTTTHA